MNARRTIYQRKVILNVSGLTEPGDWAKEGTESAAGCTAGTQSPGAILDGAKRRPRRGEAQDEPRNGPLPLPAATV
jgi:hypothetical protein